VNTNIPMIKLIEAMNDQPIAFNKHYVFIGCGINGALMLSQLVYWTSRTKNKDGWIYKDHHDWTMETGLTRKEQHTARKTLKDLGFISEKKHGVPPRIYFRVERENLYKALIKYSESLAAPQLCHTEQLNVPKGTIECAEEHNYMCHTEQLNVPKGARNTENTYREYTENTSESVSSENPVVPETQNPEENLIERTLKIWTPNLDDLNSWLQRSGLPKITQAQAEEILLEVNPHYENKIHTGAVTASQMYSNFVKWVKRDSKLSGKLFEQAAKTLSAQEPNLGFSLPEKPKGFLGGQNA